jgi:hypothetical protein
MPVPDFSPGEVLTAAAMDSIGLWLVKTQTVGAGVSSVTVTDAFSANYDNYLIQYNGGVQSADINLQLQLGSTTSNYYMSLLYGSFLGGAPQNAAQNNTASWGWGGGGNTAVSTIHCHILNPFKTQQTHMQSFIRYSSVYGTGTCYQGDATSFTAFTVIPATGTLTGGVIKVYGYRN